MLKETFVCLKEETVPKDVWKYVVGVLGEPSAMTPGITSMLKLYVVSWVLQGQVCHYKN